MSKKRKFAQLALACLLPLSACTNTSDDVSADKQAEGLTVQDRHQIHHIDALPGDKWNLATIGVRGKSNAFLSKVASLIIEDLWLIERASGATYSLKPDGLGEITNSYFISGEAGPIKNDYIYEARHPITDANPAQFYLLNVNTEEGGTILCAGSLQDKKTVKLGGPYRSILHMDTLGDSRLAVYAKQNDETRRIVFDLTSMAQLEDKPIKP